MGAGGSGEVEVDESVRLTRVTDLLDVNSVLAKSIGVGAPFVSEQITTATTSGSDQIC